MTENYFTTNVNAIYEDGRLYYVKECDYCGKTFKASRANGRYCCTKCHDSDQRRKRIEYKEVIPKEEREKILKGLFLAIKKFCAHCGKEFIAYKQTTMFCSSACAKRYRIRQNLEQKATKVADQYASIFVGSQSPCSP